MFYIINNESNKDGFDTIYVLYHIETMSRFKVSRDKLKELIVSNKIQVKNAYIDEMGELIIRGWTLKLLDTQRLKDNKYRYIVTHELDSTYKFVTTNNSRLTYTWGEAMEAGQNSEIANAVMQGDKCKFIDTIKIHRDAKFEQRIDREYTKYVAKSKLLGRDIRFKYEILGTDVILTEYTGKSKNIVLPPFITSINRESFFLCQIESIKLNEGLKFIGEQAFIHCALKEVVIPSTVEIISIKAFVSNARDLVNTERTAFTKHTKFMGDKNKIIII